MAEAISALRVAMPHAYHLGLHDRFLIAAAQRRDGRRTRVVTEKATRQKGP
jgi:hypothetical protein